MYRNLENIDEKILREYIHQSAENGLGNATARTVSNALGISDFTIFSHFQTIIGLRTQAYTLVVDSIMDASEKVTFDSPTVLFDWMFDYFLTHPDEVLFYGQVLPIVGFSPKKFEDANPRYVKFVKNFLTISEGLDDQECLIVFDFILRSLVMYACRIVKGEFDNTPAFRQIIKRMVFTSLTDLPV